LEGFVLVAPAIGQAWSGRVSADDKGVSVGWVGRAVPVAGAGGEERTFLGEFGGGLVSCARKPGAIELWTSTAAEVRRLGGVKVGDGFVVAPLLRNGRVAAVWTEPETDGQEGPAPMLGPTKRQQFRTRVVEISAFTGRVLYDGAALKSGPVSSQELKLLAAVLVAVMAVILLFVLRPEREGPPLTLPRDMALAEPGRRVLAGAVDVLLAAGVGSRVSGVSLLDLFSPTQLLMDAAPVVGLLVTVGVGMALGTLCEGLWGRTLGKLITGCEVVRPAVRVVEGAVVPAPERPGLGRALARNVVKWVVPPVAASGVFAPERRHRGDTLAGTAVVVRLEEEPAEPTGETPPQEPGR
jgi:hypothetical protein